MSVRSADQLPRISRYTSPSEMLGTHQELMEHYPGVAPAPPSPTSSLKTNVVSGTGYAASHAYSGQVEQEGRRQVFSPGDISSPHLGGQYGGPLAMTSSPQILPQRESSWPTEGLRDMHLSGHEPRYIPGMMARASRRHSRRHSSTQESDDGTPSRKHS